jgi:mannose/cellobiose epimerase-like protein (N-acyl-D-glucosamine 2-epimerase family)
MIKINTKHLDERERKFFLGIRKAIRQDTQGEFLPKSMKPQKNNTYQGYCYAAAEAFFHLICRKGYKMAYLNLDKLQTHWYITTSDGRIIDPTADQYTHSPPYELGRNCGALTKQPSKRAAKLMSLVRRIVYE